MSLLRRRRSVRSPRVGPNAPGARLGPQSRRTPSRREPDLAFISTVYTLEIHTPWVYTETSPLHRKDDMSVDTQALGRNVNELLVLATLEDGPRHGYQIALDVEEETDGAFCVTGITTTNPRGKAVTHAISNVVFTCPHAGDE